jgi:hypothetical protein
MRSREHEKRFGLPPSPSEKAPDEDNNNNKGLEKTLHTFTSFWLWLQPHQSLIKISS